MLLQRIWSRGQLRWYSRWVVWGGALGMIVLGAAHIAWATHLGMVTGDWEYYGLLGGALIAL